MIKKIIVICLMCLSTLVMADSTLKFETKEVKIVEIDTDTLTISFYDKTRKQTMKLDEEIIEFGFYESDVISKKIESLELNQKYFIRIAHENYKDEKNKDISNSYVSFIGTVPYDTLY